MTATFEIKRTADGKYLFNLKSANDQVILTSQAYENKEAAEAGISSVRHNAMLDEQYEEKIGSDGHPYFVLFAVNRKEIGRSQMYSSREAMRKGIASVKRNSQIAISVDLSARVRTAGGEMAAS